MNDLSLYRKLDPELMIEHKMKAEVKPTGLFERNAPHKHRGLADDLKAKQIFKRQLAIMQLIDCLTRLIHRQHVAINHQRLWIGLQTPQPLI